MYKKEQIIKMINDEIYYHKEAIRRLEYIKLETEDLKEYPKGYQGEPEQSELEDNK